MFTSPNGRILDAADQDMLEEECRLFYVASPAPRMNSTPNPTPETSSAAPSRILEDFPQDLVEEWNVGNDNPWSDGDPF